jgi:hypothetical protein
MTVQRTIRYGRIEPSIAKKEKNFKRATVMPPEGSAGIIAVEDGWAGPEVLIPTTVDG